MTFHVIYFQCSKLFLTFLPYFDQFSYERCSTCIGIFPDFKIASKNFHKNYFIYETSAYLDKLNYTLS